MWLSYRSASGCHRALGALVGQCENRNCVCPHVAPVLLPWLPRRQKVFEPLAQTPMAGSPKWSQVGNPVRGKSAASDSLQSYKYSGVFALAGS